MLYFINLNQVNNINPRFGANFHAGSQLGDLLLDAVAEAFAGMHQQVSEETLAEVRAYQAGVEASGEAMAPFIAISGDYQLTLTPQAEVSVPWIVESILEGRALQAA